jgi:cell division protein FtsI (penicillin-binding protein 3)
MNYFKSTQTKKLVTLPAWRSRLLFILLLAGMGILILRAAYLQSINNNFLQQKGNARSSHVMAISAHRGMIADRHGEPLAISTPVESIGVNPQDVEVTPQQLNQLARIMSMDIKEVKRRLLDTTHDFVHLQRQLPPAQVEQIVKLGVPGLLLQREYRRYYPGGEVTAHLIGFTSVDDNGQEGLELAL